VEGPVRPRILTVLAALAAALVAGGLVLGLLALEGEGASPGALPLSEIAAPLVAGADAEIEGRIRVLASLAASPVLDRPGADLAGLYAHARAAAGTLEAPVVVADLSLAQLVHSGLPFGTILSGLSDTAVALRALETGRPAVGLGAAEGGGVAPMLIAVPVKRARATIAAVISEVQPATMGSLLGRLAPARTAVALMDEKGQLAAASAGFPPLPPMLAGQGRLQVAGTTFDYVAQNLHAVPRWRLVVARKALPPMPWLTRPRLLAALAAAAFAAFLATLATRRHMALARLEMEARAPEALSGGVPAMLTLARPNSLARPGPQDGTLPVEDGREGPAPSPLSRAPEEDAR